MCWKSPGKWFWGAPIELYRSFCGCFASCVSLWHTVTAIVHFFATMKQFSQSAPATFEGYGGASVWYPPQTLWVALSSQLIVPRHREISEQQTSAAVKSKTHTHTCGHAANIISPQPRQTFWRLREEIKWGDTGAIPLLGPALPVFIPGVPAAVSTPQSRLMLRSSTSKPPMI